MPTRYGFAAALSYPGYQTPCGPTASLVQLEHQTEAERKGLGEDLARFRLREGEIKIFREACSCSGGFPGGHAKKLAGTCCLQKVEDPTRVPQTQQDIPRMNHVEGACES